MKFKLKKLKLMLAQMVLPITTNHIDDDDDDKYNIIDANLIVTLLLMPKMKSKLLTQLQVLIMATKQKNLMMRTLMINCCFCS